MLARSCWWNLLWCLTVDHIPLTNPKSNEISFVAVVSCPLFSSQGGQVPASNIRKILASFLYFMVKIQFKGLAKRRLQWTYVIASLTCDYLRHRLAMP